MNIFQRFLSSSKLQGAVATIAFVLLNEAGLGLDEATVNKVVFAALAWIGAQGLADWGKEAKK